MTVAEFNEHYLKVLELRRAEEILASLEAAACPQAAKLTGAPRSGAQGRRVEDLTVEISEAKDVIAEIRRSIAETEGEISLYISGVADYHTRTIFRLHYIRGLSWRQVAEIIGGKNTRDTVKKACYRQILKNSPHPSRAVPGGPKKKMV